MSELVLYETRGAVALLTLNRPEKLNALNYAVVDRLLALLDRIELASEVRAVILTGAGERAFSAGADIAEFSETVWEGPDVALRAFVRRGQSMTARIEAFSKPVIVAVNGLAYGGGCEINEAAHLAVASERATFAKSEINIGIPPTFGGTQRLPRLAGRKRALELLLTGDPFSAQRAYELGLVNRVVPYPSSLAACRIPNSRRGHARIERLDRRGARNRERAVRAHGADLRHARSARRMARPAAGSLPGAVILAPALSWLGRHIEDATALPEAWLAV
jgi:enoyl-CoA hydratase